MKTPTTGLVTFLLVIGLLPSSTAQTSPLKVSQSGPSRFVESASQVIDHGPLAAESPDTPISVTIALGLSNLDEAENLQQSIYTPGNANQAIGLFTAQFSRL